MNDLSPNYCWHRDEDGKKCSHRAVWWVREYDLVVCHQHGVLYQGMLEELRPRRKRGLPSNFVRLNKGMDEAFRRTVR